MDAAPVVQEEQPQVSGMPEAQEAEGEGKEAVLQRRVALLLSTATATIFDYIAQARMRWLNFVTSTGAQGAVPQHLGVCACRGCSSGTS